MEGGSGDQSLTVDPLSYFSFQPVLHMYKKFHGMSYPVCGVMHIKDPSGNITIILKQKHF